VATAATVSSKYQAGRLADQIRVDRARPSEPDIPVAGLPGNVEARTLAGPGLDSGSLSTARQRGFVRFAAT
jgi:hypothetical protein